ncbi:lactonase family protein [Lactobacillus gigeriorum]|uniref:3-carboxymuconate cyclase n=1 Tax=Lactobacillus gigeriorum DSM 23908 = CRBIP 24.85 TaxID=1423751 RepID=I7J356_9LACO|nr:lactonase family protein [Lactobacillus gigeriorum]KRN14872.1 carboxy-cis,cis-muconate cyclase [Lactobacillus gigeriorum DSM 23908 = CRBIP 24.85]CCI87337.1 3-carboxymuconate cyclase [Lactobacillus gigeriorum DSM 23908 = CRBIP 24.85]
MKVLIGGYTKNNSKGIYELTLSGKEHEARLENANNIIEIGGPTYFQKDGDLIFAINNAGDQGGISAFKLVNGNYQEVDHALTPGSSPAYIGINREKNLLYTANYHTAVLTVFSYDNEGKLTALASVTHTADTLGPRPEQVDGPHPHYFDETPAGNLVSCDLGNDRVDFYRLTSDHKLEHLTSYHNEAGFGTRHLVFSKDGNYFYVVGELSSKVNVVKFNESTWEFEDIATYSTIPESWDQHNGAAAIKISQDGKFIYVSNRGNDSLVVFKVLDDHKLQQVQRISVFGEFPRDFNWDASERYVVATNQNTNNATLYLRDKATGTLVAIQKDITVPEGTRVLFVED